MDHVVQYHAPATPEQLKALLVSWLVMYELTRSVKWVPAPRGEDPAPVFCWAFSARRNSKFRQVIRYEGAGHSLVRLCAENGYESSIRWYDHPALVRIIKRSTTLHRTRLRRYREISVDIARTGRAPEARTEP